MAFERLLPGTIEWDLYYSNHLVRYQFALDYLLNHSLNKVLDAATGVGYGANFLSTSGIKEVIAIDRDNETIHFANKNYKDSSVKFLVDDCENLSHCDEYFPFDAVISFETVEHLKSPDLFLKECYKSLKNNGTLIMSTPNKLVTNPDGKKNWEYHEKEYTPQELVDILQDNGYADITIYGQQLTSIGKLRQQIRSEFNKINSTPFIRLGKWIQKILRRRTFKSILPEQTEDFEIVEYTELNKIVEKGINGPFVLMAICKKK